MEFRLRSAVGKRKVKRRRRAAHSATKLERNVARRAADGSRRLCGYSRMDVARDERAICVEERAWSRGDRADRIARGTKQTRVGHGDCVISFELLCVVFQ